jgi:beta-glucosidase
MSQENVFPYQDTSLPVEQRVTDLLGRMTLAEKLAQLGAAWFSEISQANPLDASAGAARFTIDLQKAAQRIGNGIGTLTRPDGSVGCTPDQSAQINNTVQAYLLEHTRLGIPALVHEECLAGLMARRATAFPQVIGLASTWNPDLVEAVASVISLQTRAVGAHQGLAPVLDVTRDPRWGRIEETYGEDPYLAARLGVAYVTGLQGSELKSGGIVATGKHFAAHGMPESGQNWAPVHLGERELRETYLFPFEAVVKEAHLAGIMNAYHELDGIPCAASRWLLTDVLREEWGFNGIVVSDYNAIIMLADYHHVASDKGDAACQALRAGLDVELPQTDCYGAPLLDAIQAGKLEMNVIDTSVRRILSLKFRLGLFEDPFVDPAAALQAYGRLEQDALTYRAAQESLVLLKNEGGLLPLDPGLDSLAVIGPNADSVRNMLGDYSYGAFTALMDGGEKDASATQFPERFPPGMRSILDGIRQRVSGDNRVLYARGCEYSGTSRDGFAEAVDCARRARVAVLVMGGKSGLTQDCTSGELRDRARLGLPGVQEELVQSVLATGTPVVLVLVDGRPAAIPELAQQVPAILQAWLPGEEGALAVADALFGEYNPGGKLPVTFPRSPGQVPIFYGRKPSGGKSYNFNDYVDESAQPLFPFGHGLSYTSFEYRSLSITPAQLAPNAVAVIECEIANTGDRAGDEVVQLYVRDELASLTRPLQELKGFQRISLQPGETRRVTFHLSAAQLAFYDSRMRYIVEPGWVEVMLGSSSADIRLRDHFEIVDDVTEVTHKVFFSW